MAQRSIPAPFLTKTYEMVDDQITNDVISWNEDETSFVVWKTADFSKDLLPKYFKHNNFSSFIRQLNTYGFRKVVPDKWEFANEHFRKNQKELLFKIRRRKAPSLAKTLSDGGENSGNLPLSPSNFGDDVGSTSITSQDLKDHLSSQSVEISTQFTDLSGENKKLKRDNETLLTELAQTKKQCDKLIAFLTQYENLEPDQINHTLRDVISLNEHRVDIDAPTHDKTKDDDDNVSLKLFGVWLKKTNKKRGRDENTGPHCAKEIKTMDYFHHSPLIKSSKICN